MKKKLVLSLLLVVCLLTAMSAAAYAESYTGGAGWTATFTADGKMVSTFKSAELADAIADLQPGDDITVTITLSNQNTETVDWYMYNKVLKSMEDGTAASGGAYSYDLSYVGPGGAVQSLFSSDAVGGEKAGAGDKSPEGLHAATGAMEDYFYLGSMAKGQSGVITLRVALDGESLGNVYQSKLADLQMRFGVEVGNRSFVRTGDETNTLPYLAVMAVSGVVLLSLGFGGLRLRKKGGEKA